MSLIPCKECGNQISKTADACPQCGAKVPHTSLFTKVVAALFVIGIAGAVLSQRNQSTHVAPPANAIAQPVSEQPNPDLHWNYRDGQDSMGRGTVEMAAVRSTNEIEFGFPYQGSQRGTLMLRSHPKHGKDAILTVERGQFLCGIDSCPVSVRFDENKPQTYNATEPSDRRTTTLFIHNYDRFLAGLKKSHKVSIEARFYQEGNRVFEFDTTGLEWEGPQAEKKSNAMKIIFHKGVSPETKAQILEILHGQIDDESFNDPNYIVQFWSEDGFYIAYEVTYKGKVRHTSNGKLMNPGRFEEEIQNEW